jgi:hypothetical protein
MSTVICFFILSWKVKPALIRLKLTGSAHYILSLLLSRCFFNFFLDKDLILVAIIAVRSTSEFSSESPAGGTSERMPSSLSKVLLKLDWLWILSRHFELLSLWIVFRKLLFCDTLTGIRESVASFAMVFSEWELLSDCEPLLIDSLRPTRLGRGES